MRQANIYQRDRLAGLLTEDEQGYTFLYDVDFLQSDEAEAEAISLTLPLCER
ncbi:MAG: HipA N-terminal domain-containing protein [Akkermansia sp.]